MILLYGLLHGEIQLTGDAVEKIFECFSCGQCEKSCSSGVPILKVFTAAREDLLAMGCTAVGTASQTDEGRCARCLSCIRVCKHEARSFHKGVMTDLAKCASCGNCIDACPASAIHLGKGYGLAAEEMLQGLRDFLIGSDTPAAKGVAFTCSWSSYPGLQTARLATAGSKSDHLTLITGCAGRLPSSILLEAFNLGAWGVLVSRCSDEECTHGGSVRARQRIEALQGALDSIGIDPARLRSIVSPKGDSKAFVGAITDFMTDISSLGPVWPLC